ncbi:RdgB/HAM1 family non-canonical purine NTP pyrophosphatase [Parvibium lacunae]|uniref:dITP/XTP pyrophosphatase n=1 Tax=Parvibium lacunae TaxID=1888893 RepID=A0A368L7K8_9BURK|nr:RdgB/HAM1 family non-canonical purine NTP pyrophosphatase [Parvibium lacunae]RCS59491.1 RdgB/HAM1 family non-canonical purine NTP pyrophosphatase [Parvibium lacunae]
MDSLGNTLILASENTGKLREFNALLAPLKIDVVPQSAFKVPEVAEPFQTFIENALAKARHASQHTGLPALADDSGICVPALGGAPGVHSARFASLLDGLPRDDDRNNTRLVSELAAHADRRAYYYCVLVLVRAPHDPQPLIADGSWYGEIVSSPRGTAGFGYDPHFWLSDLQKTAAELTPAEKNQLSHRAQAIQRLLSLLQRERASIFQK